MMYKPDVILEEQNSFLSLEDCDVTMTSKPKGVGVVEKDASFIDPVFTSDRLLVEEHWEAV